MAITIQKQLETLSSIRTELMTGIKQLSKYGLKTWRYNVNELHQKIGVIDKRINHYLPAQLEKNSRKISRDIEMDSKIIAGPFISDAELKELYDLVYDLIQGVRNLTTTYRLTDARFVKATDKYCELLDELNSSQKISLTDSQLNYLFHGLHRGADYHSISAKFQSEKKSTKEKIKKSLDDKLEDYKQERIEEARKSLLKEDSKEIQIEYESVNFVNFRRVADDQKDAHYKAFKNHFSEIFEMQKSYPLNPAFANAVGKLMMYLQDNIDTQRDLTLQITAKTRQNELLTQTNKSKKRDESEEIVVDQNAAPTTTEELSKKFINIVHICNKFQTGIEELRSSFSAKGWNSDINNIKNNFKSLKEKLAEFMADKPQQKDEQELKKAITSEELKEIFDQLFNVMLAICQLSTKNRLTEINLVGPFIDYCKFLITSHTKLLRDFEMKRINCSDKLFDLKTAQYLKPLLGHGQLTDIYKDLLEGAKWPSKSAYFNEYRRQKKQELAAALEFICEELEEEIKKSACSKLSQDMLSTMKVKPTTTLSFKRYNHEQRKDVYKELEYYFFEVLELQKDSPLNEKLASGIEKFISALKKNYDKTQIAMKALAKETHEKESTKNTIRRLSAITGSSLEDKQKLYEIQKLLPGAVEKRLEQKAETEDEDELSNSHSPKLIKNSA